jgi:peptide/nickel transport system permease protein/dipeptide transport system permease protein
MFDMYLRGFFFTPFINRAGTLGMLTIFLITGIGILGPWVSNIDPYHLSDQLLAPPSWVSIHALGTDDLGRDQLARLIYGARNSLLIGLGVVLISSLIGTTLGLYAACYGRFIDMLIMRSCDIVMSLPGILLAIIIVAVLGPGLINAMLAVALVSIPRFVRVVRSVAIAEMQKPYILAARTCGASRQKIIWSEVLPNCWNAIIVQTSLGFSDAIVEISALGFLGLGAQPPTAEWGTMLADSRAFMESAPRLMIMPGLCILITVVSFNLLGDALQDRLDPNLKNRS